MPSSQTPSEIITFDAAKALSPERLGITTEERSGLIAVMEFLRSSQAKHAPSDDFVRTCDVPHDRPVTVGFNMALTSGSSEVFESFHCGCVACIGGYLSMHLQGIPVLSGGEVCITPKQEEAIDDYVSGVESPGLRDLFYPHGLFGEVSWGLLTPITAADAISNYLLTGDANWSEAALRNGQGKLLSVEEA